jgi:hypothetical protein
MVRLYSSITASRVATRLLLIDAGNRLIVVAVVGAVIGGIGI